MTFKMPRNLMTAISVVAFAVMLQGCGGGGGSSPVATMDDETTIDDTTIDDTTIDDTTPPTTIVGQTLPDGTMIPLPAGVELPDIEVTAVMGQTIPYPGIGTFTCASADGCSVVVADNVITTTGDIVVDSVADDSVDALIYAALNTEPVELDELQTAQAAAADAVTAAMTAAGNANTTAMEAETARATAATLQTGETSEGLAEKAREQAGMAHTAYMDAKAASEAAAAADNVSDAIRAQVDAENARDAAQTAETNADNYAQMAADAADGELMIDVTVKSVGDTTIDAAASRSVVTAGEGATAQVTDTGLQAKGDLPMATGSATDGKAAVHKSGPGVSPAMAYVAPVVNAAERDIPAIGKTVDSADDTARLMIVTHYAGTNTVEVYAAGAVEPNLEGREISDVKIQTVGVTPPGGTPDASDDKFVTLKSVGMYYLAGTDATLTAGPADSDDTVLADTKPREVFLVSGTGMDSNPIAGGIYVVRDVATKDADGNIQATFRIVVIHVAVNRDGIGNNDTPADLEMVEVTASIPEATAYKHIHFGVWAGLGAAKLSGAQVPADLGIGFVQSIGDGLSGADMPNNGKANYTGNWVATVQEEDPDGNGDISLEYGDATLAANFGKATIKATLNELATLEGTIDTNTFSGTKATGIADTHGLDSDGTFTGSFSGGFYGSKAAEAGGVFDFTSEAAEAGAFRGAFGGDRNPE